MVGLTQCTGNTGNTIVFGLIIVGDREAPLKQSCVATAAGHGDWPASTIQTARQVKYIDIILVTCGLITPTSV